MNDDHLYDNRYDAPSFGNLDRWSILVLCRTVIAVLGDSDPMKLRHLGLHEAIVKVAGYKRLNVAKVLVGIGGFTLREAVVFHDTCKLVERPVSLFVEPAARRTNTPSSVEAEVGSF